jgi:hypothetical protein
MNHLRDLKYMSVVVGAVVLLAYLITRPHLVTVWHVEGANGIMEESPATQAICESDATAHNQRANDVNIYGRYACVADVQFQWGW